MKKFTLALMLVAMALLAFPGVTSATPVEDLTGLSGYFPDNTTAFAALRTDPGYVETLDGVLTTVVNRLPEDLVGDEIPPLGELVDFAAMSVFGQPYTDGLDAWLGGTAAAGIFNLGALLDAGMAGEEVTIDDASFIVALEITDRAAAVEFLAMSMGVEAFETTDTYDLIDMGGVGLVITDDALLLGPTDLAIEAAEGWEATLTDSENFSTTLDTFPADGYNIMAYLDLDTIIPLVMQAIEQQAMMSGDEAVMELFESNAMMAQAGGALAMGFTVLDGRTLTLDLVGIQNGEAIEMMREMPGFVEQNPVDLEFAEFLPDHAQLVIHDNGFAQDFLALFDALDAAGPMLQEQLDALFNAMDGGDMLAQETGGLLTELPVDLGAINFGGLAQFPLTVTFAGLTGLNLEDDVLSWMTGDYATFFSLIPVEGDLGFSLDMATVWEATNDRAAAEVVEGLIASADAYGVDYFTESIGGGQALGYPNLIPMFFTGSGLREIADNTPELDVMVGSNGDVFVFGSRPAVEAALNPTSPLADDETFQYAAETAFLEDTVTVWYIGTPALVEALPALAAIVPPEDLEMLNELGLVLSTIESATITGRLTDDGGVLRLTLTLEDEPFEPFDFGMEMEAVEEAETEADTVEEATPVPVMTATAPADDVDEPAATEEASGG